MPAILQRRRTGSIGIPRGTLCETAGPGAAGALVKLPGGTTLGLAGGERAEAEAEESTGAGA